MEAEHSERLEKARRTLEGQVPATLTVAVNAVRPLEDPRITIALHKCTLCMRCVIVLWRLQMVADIDDEMLEEHVQQEAAWLTRRKRLVAIQTAAMNEWKDMLQAQLVMIASLLIH